MLVASESAGAAATSDIAAVMRRLGVAIRVVKDQQLFAQDAEADLVHLLTSGCVRTSRLLADGRRHVGGFYFPGDLVGVETGAVHRFTAEALSDCALLVVRRAAVKAFAGDRELDRAIWDATRRELERTQAHLLVLSRKSACEKVAGFLMSLARRTGAEPVNLPMSRQDIADYLDLTIETVSRMLTQLQGASVVQFEGLRRFKVNRWQTLEAMAA